MNIQDKIKKLKKTKKSDIFKIAGTEKTGVVNSLVLLGSIASFFAAVEHEVHAQLSLSCDSKGEITDTHEFGVLDSSSNWRNHCWSWGWGWCWSWHWSWGHSAG
ncbi:MAG: hypothetical protein DRN71_04075 [Candidatus Nanohalarchaeota archaeon]|nr:MAG: hypothetical protein DRN71_04075 [Candidatus Nanohaloarchaeota archaeon]